MFQEHPYHSLQVPSDAPFCLKPSPGKGWGAFATRRIERGAMIFREKPLIVIRKPLGEDFTEEEIQTAFQGLVSSEKQQFLCLRENSYEPFTNMRRAFIQNNFLISKPWFKGPPVYGLYLLNSRFNHSCLPNSKAPSAGEETMTRFAIRDIAAGEEITFCYKTYFEIKTRRERHEELEFTCNCKACLVGTPFQQLSDLRRTFLRGLHYLKSGRDPNGEIEGSTSPIIFDPSLKKAAETYSIRISTLMVYEILVVYLLEEEGVLCDFMLEIMMAKILEMPGIFMTAGNARIARLAMMQETWLGKLCTAFKMFGRRDAADYGLMMALRTHHGC